MGYLPQGQEDRPGPTPRNPQEVEWKIGSDGVGRYVCKSSGRRMTSRGTCATVTWTEGAKAKARRLCLEAGHPAVICVRLKGDESAGQVAAKASAYRSRIKRKTTPDIAARECAATGMPPGLIPGCVKARVDGVTMDKILEELKKMSPQDIAALTGGGQGPNARRPEGTDSSKVVMYGGIAVGAALVVALVRKRKR